MLFVISFIAIFIAAMGLGFMLNPGMLKQVVAFFGKGKRIYLAGILRLLIGVTLLTAALECQRPMVIIVFGILFIIGGVVIFALGLEKAKSILARWEKKPALVARLIGLLVFVVGALIGYGV